MKNIRQTLEVLWDGVDSSAWTAPRKTRYHQEIYQQICDAGSEIENNIQELENYSRSCMDKCNIV